MNSRSCTHGAEFDGDKQLAVDETVISEVSTCFAQGQDFSMSSGIVLADVAIPTPAYAYTAQLMWNDLRLRESGISVVISLS